MTDFEYASTAMEVHLWLMITKCARLLSDKVGRGNIIGNENPLESAL
jgi:hypothetical protein